MQRFPCPFCGLRDETEFHFVTEAGKARPEPAAEVSDATWSAYLYDAASPEGKAREVWLHLTCGEYCLLTRDTRSRAVLESAALPEAGP